MSTIIHVDRELQELIPGFLENRNNDIETLKKAIQRQDYGAIQCLGHTLKGIGSSYGFDLLSELGFKIENAAKNNDLYAISELLVIMLDYLDDIEIIYI